MITAFGDLWQSMQGQFDATFGEPIRIEPQAESTRRSRYIAGGPDPNVLPRDVVGIFTDDIVADRVLGSGANTHENADILAEKAQVDFDASLFDAASLPLAGWCVVLTARVGQPRYRISSTKPDSVARVICPVTFVEMSAPGSPSP